MRAFYGASIKDERLLVTPPPPLPPTPWPAAGAEARVDLLAADFNLSF